MRSEFLEIFFQRVESNTKRTKKRKKREKPSRFCNSLERKPTKRKAFKDDISAKRDEKARLRSAVDPSLTSGDVSFEDHCVDNDEKRLLQKICYFCNSLPMLDAMFL